VTDHLLRVELTAFWKASTPSKPLCWKPMRDRPSMRCRPICAPRSFPTWAVSPASTRYLGNPPQSAEALAQLAAQPVPCANTCTATA
jgi:hypothetical protein